MELTVYLAGQIHDDWRDALEAKAKENKLPLHFVGPQTNHDKSDNIGEELLGKPHNNIQTDGAAPCINYVMTQILMEKTGHEIALFGENFKPWNTAMDPSL